MNLPIHKHRLLRGIAIAGLGLTFTTWPVFAQPGDDPAPPQQPAAAEQAQPWDEDDVEWPEGEDAQPLPFPEFVPVPGAQGPGQQGRPEPVEPRPLDASEAQRILEGFIASVGEDESFDAELRKDVLQRLRADLDGPFDPADALGDAVADLVPAFADGLDGLFDEDMDAALAGFRGAIGHANPYVDAHGRFYAAQVLINQERFEEALELLEPLTERDADKTLYAADAAFYRGVAEARTLQRREALATMKGFLESFPDASARMTDGARQMAYDLELLIQYEGYLEDVHDRMQFSRRKLAQAQTGEPTQKQHRRIVEILERLIEEAEQQEDQGGGGGGDGGGQSPQDGQQGGSGDPSGGPGGAQHSAAVPGAGGMGPQQDAQTRAETWGGLPPHEREQIMHTLQERYPDHYRALIEQYYQGLREGSTDVPEQSGEAFDQD